MLRKEGCDPTGLVSPKSPAKQLSHIVYTYILTDKPKFKWQLNSLGSHRRQLLRLRSSFLQLSVGQILIVKEVFRVVPAVFTSIFIWIPPFKQRVADRKTVDDFLLTKVDVIFLFVLLFVRLELSCEDLRLYRKFNHTVGLLELDKRDLVSDKSVIILQVWIINKILNHRELLFFNIV